MRVLVFILILLLAFASCSSCEDGEVTGGQPTPTSTPVTYNGAGIPDASPVQSEAAIDILQLEMQIHDLTNIERSKKGLSTLSWDGDLSIIARKHSQDMASRGYFSHTSPEGYKAIDRCRQEGFTVRRIPAGGNTYLLGCTQKYYLGCAENLFRGSLVKRKLYVRGVYSHSEYYTQDEIAAQAVEGWMTSPGHRENLLFRYWESEGIGVAISSDGLVYVTQNFN